MTNLFPYTDAHELNLDWVIKQVKANDTKVKDLTNTVINMHFDFDSKADKATTYTKTEVNTLLAAKADTSSLASVATSGSYTDLINKPTIPAAQVNSDWDAVSGVAQILNKPSLSSVATSGNYNDLSNKPTIPAAQVNSDWDALSGVAQILNKPDISVVTNPADITFTPESAFTVDRFYVKKQLNVYTIVLQVTYTGPTTNNVKVGSISGITANAVPVYSPVVSASNDYHVGAGEYTNGDVWIKLSTTSYTKIGLYFTVIR